MNKKILCAACLSLAVFTSHASSYNKSLLRKINSQMKFAIEENQKDGKILNPVTISKDGSISHCDYGDWRSGFFPGSLWYMYEITGEEVYKDYAKKHTENIRKAQDITWNHDIGFIINCSFGNGLNLSGTKEYKEVIVKSAKSLITRFKEKPGIIQSWDVKNGWQSERGWECPVIIDNMMNLELLFKATEFSKDSIFYKIAISHADQTLKEHFRPDGSCYHVVDYDLTTGKVRKKQTAQGYSDESAWSRGQAWAIYGYMICYRYTKEAKYLDQAIKTFEMMKTNTPVDGVPYWDIDAPGIPNEPRDASAAACIASALYEITLFTKDKQFAKYADKILKTLSSPEYLAVVGSNGGFLLKHSVGSIPHGAEIDVPLNYADYYYLEALIRQKNMK